MVRTAAAVSPDGIKPVDFDLWRHLHDEHGPTCDFVYTGYRVPLIVVSPYAAKHYVSHTVLDYTAILKLIEARFKLSSLTKRDAGAEEHDGVFQFNVPPWITAANAASAVDQRAVLSESTAVSTAETSRAVGSGC